MTINTKVRYGMRAMIDIAKAENPGGVLQKDIAINQSISVKYLDPIIASLKAKGLIANSKGKGSGYRLTRPADKITALDIYTAFEPITVVDCIDSAEFCNRSCECCSRTYWKEFRDSIIKTLSEKNLSQIINCNNSIITAI